MVPDIEPHPIWKVCQETTWHATNHAMALWALGSPIDASPEKIEAFIHLANSLHSKLIALTTKVAIFRRRAIDGHFSIDEEDWESAHNLAAEIVSAILPLEEILPEDSPQNTLLGGIRRLMDRYNTIILDLRPSIKEKRNLH